MPAQDRVRSDQAATPQCPRQPPHEGGEYGPVCPVHARTRVGAAQDGDLVAEDEEFDVLGRGRTTRQQDQPEHLPEEQVEQPQRHVGIMSDQRSLLVSDPDRLLAPHRPSLAAVFRGGVLVLVLFGVGGGVGDGLAARCALGGTGYQAGGFGS